MVITNDNADHALCIDALSIDTSYNYTFDVFNITEDHGYFGYYGHHYGGMQHVVIELTGSWIGGAGNDIIYMELLNIQYVKQKYLIWKWIMIQLVQH